MLPVKQKLFEVLKIGKPSECKDNIWRTISAAKKEWILFFHLTKESEFNFHHGKVTESMHR